MRRLLGTFLLGLAVLAGTNAEARTVLNAPLTLYVDLVNGSDANDGLSWGSPLQHAQTAVDRAVNDYDRGIHSITIVHAGPYSNSSAIQTITTELKLTGGGLGSGIITFDGGGSTIHTTNGTNAVANYGAPGFFSIQYVNLKTEFSGTPTTATRGYCVIVQTAGYVVIGPGVRLQECFRQGLVAAAPGALLQIGSAGTVVEGDMPSFVLAADGGLVCGTDSATTVWLVNTPTFTGGTVHATVLGIVQLFNFTFSGTGTGSGTPRYVGSLNGVIYTAGGGANYFPGTQAGSLSSGAQYQ